MFTGLVEAIGTVTGLRTSEAGADLSVRYGPPADDPFALGESIAVDGCCLTVTKYGPSRFEVEASRETLARTTIGALRVGQQVNLERAAKLGQRMGGHIVTGHVDATAILRSRKDAGKAIELEFELPGHLLPFVAEKGSIAVAGVSLTVNHVSADAFGVTIIPLTQSHTTLGSLGTGMAVNLEVDVLARYAVRALTARGRVEPTSPDESLQQTLVRAGYLV